MTTTTSRYVRHRRIATGGMGEVWLAEDSVLHRNVAVKYLKREYSDDADFHTRFLVEARTAASLHHPGIATVFDFGESTEEDGLPFLVMEYVEGQPLSDLLRSGPLVPERARDLVLQAATALAEAHSRDLVHRDVKPANLLVTADDTVKITDFGIARAGDGAALTATGQILGTPSYLSPEQAEGRSSTPASDVYALGVVLFECLSGRRPFVADSAVAIALAHVRDPIPELPAEIPQDLAAVARQALAKDPADRFPDATALATALAATRSTGGTQVLDTAAIRALSTAPAPAHERPWPLIGAAVLLAVLLGTALVVNLAGGSETQNTPSAANPTSASSVTSVTTTMVPVRAVDYLGKPLAVVRAALVALGVTPRVGTPVANPGGETAGTVAAIRPTGTVAEGSTVTVQVWGAAPKQTTTPPNNVHNAKPGKGKGKGKH